MKRSIAMTLQMLPGSLNQRFCFFAHTRHQPILKVDQSYKYAQITVFNQVQSAIDQTVLPIVVGAVT